LETDTAIRAIPNGAERAKNDLGFLCAPKSIKMVLLHFLPRFVIRRTFGEYCRIEVYVIASKMQFDTRVYKIPLRASVIIHHSSPNKAVRHLFFFQQAFSSTIRHQQKEQAFVLCFMPVNDNGSISIIWRNNDENDDS
jgi:hypothetical protein